MNTRLLVSLCVLIAVLLIAALLVLLLLGDRSANTPPQIASVQTQLLDNRENIQTVVDFMIRSGYENIYIFDCDGTMQADLTSQPVNDEAASCAITELLKSGKYLQISKTDNTIRFLQWRGLQDIGCGIAYSINGIDEPDVQYVTQLIPLSEKGWFYYVSDYNRWRNERE